MEEYPTMKGVLDTLCQHDFGKQLNAVSGTYTKVVIVDLYPSFDLIRLKKQISLANFPASLPKL